MALALVAGGAAGGIWWSNRADASPAAATVRTQLVAATLGTVKQTVSATGTIEPGTQATLAFGSAGTVTAVDVAVGDTVAKGATLATLDPTALEQDVALAQAGVTAAQSQVDTATAGTSAAASAQAQLASAQQQLSSAQQALAGATLESPISGVVASVGLTVGAVAGGSSGSTGGSNSGSGASGSEGGSGSAAASGGAAASGSISSSASIVVVDTSAWIVSATVPSSELASLKKGLQTTIELTGSADPIFGTVQSVGVVASSTSSGTAQFPVVIKVTGSPTGVYAGTSASVAITVKQLTDVMTVPTQAIASTGGQTTVQLSKNGVVTTTPVSVGGVYGATTQVTKGLAEGDEVVVQVRTFPGAGTTGRTDNGTGRTGGGGGGGGFGGGGFGGNGGGPPAGGPPGAGGGN